MNNIGQPWQQRRLAAFTLIELLVVIAIIAILAAMIIPISGAVAKRRKITVAQTQLKALELAIDGYKTKLGFYPPDNATNVIVNPLYFELMGTTNDGAGKPAPTLWVTLDGSAQIGTTTTPTITSVFGSNVMGIANSATRAKTDDQGAAATSFINNLTPNQIGALDSAGLVKILVCSVEWPPDKNPAPIPGTLLNPWRYNSSHPTNNTASYDLWVDVVVGNKTNRVSNWSTQPIQL